MTLLGKLNSKLKDSSDADESNKNNDQNASRSDPPPAGRHESTGASSVTSTETVKPYSSDGRTSPIKPINTVTKKLLYVNLSYTI